MKKQNLSIEIVSSKNSSLSSMSEPSRISILKVLSAKYSDVKITLVDSVDDLEKIVKRNPDLVFLGMKFIYDDIHSNNTIWLSEYFDNHGICYTGSSQKSHALEFNKDQAKETVANAGFVTADFRLIENGNESIAKFLPNFPLFIKPTDQGGGTGIDNNSLVSNIADLNSKVKSIYDDFGSNSIAESYLSGREYSVAILKNEDNNDYLIMPLELVAPLNNRGDRFLSGEIKKADTETYNKVSSKSIFSTINELALGAFNALGARDYGRIDIRFDSKGVAHFLEANLIPSLLKDYGNFPKACKLNNNLEYDSVINTIVTLSLKRKISSSYSSDIYRLPYITI